MTQTVQAATLDITQVNRTQVAKLTGTDMAHISRIFSLQRTPSLMLATRIARVLNITVDSLCEALGIDPTEDLETIRVARERAKEQVNADRVDNQSRIMRQSQG